MLLSHTTLNLILYNIQALCDLTHKRRVAKYELFEIVENENNRRVKKK